jgi:DNA invertase Pin-like site-specific DNA recombinase
MSTDKQEDSIDRQLANIRPYAERKGYLLTDELTFVDEGIAGDEFEKRAGFQRLLRDAAASRFDVIVCDEVSRLSRQKYTEFMAKVAYPLEQAGVSLDTVSQGPLAWDECVDIIKLAIHQPLAREEARKISERTLTGMRTHANLGRLLLGGRPAYGYKTVYEDIALPGRPPKVVPVRLVPDGHRAEVIRWIFERYDTGRYSLAELARELNARATPPPGRSTRKKGAPKGTFCQLWSRQAIRVILRNPVYVGSLAWNRTCQGKHHKLAAGAAVKLNGRSTTGHRNGREDWIVVENAHEPLVSQALFDRVQDRLASSRGGRRHAARQGYLLSGLLQCSRCGRALHGLTRGGEHFYRCDGYDGMTSQRICGFGHVKQGDVIKVLLKVLQDTFLDPDHLRALRAEIEQQEQAEHAPDRVAGVQADIAELTRKIDQGHRNLAVLPTDRVGKVLDVIRGLERERDALEADLRRLDGESRVKDLDAAVAAAESWLWRLREAAGGADPAVLGDLIRQMVARIEFRWDRQQRGRRTRYVLTGGVIHLRADGLSAEQVEYPVSTAGSRCFSAANKSWSWPAPSSFVSVSSAGSSP